MLNKHTLGAVLVLCGMVLMVSQAVASDAQTVGSVDTRTVVTILCGMLTAVIGLYMRGLREEVKSKADSDMVMLLVQQMTKTQDALAENVNQLNTRMHSHANKTHELQLILATQHPTKHELQAAVTAALAPLVVRIDNMQHSIDSLTNKEY